MTLWNNDTEIQFFKEALKTLLLLNNYFIICKEDTLLMYQKAQMPKDKLYKAETH